PSAAFVIVVLGLTGWMSVARLVQGEVRSLAARPFVEGARALGISRLRILWRHILPNALTPVIVAAALGIGNAIMLEAGLSFLGLGVQPPTPSWGNMIAWGGAPWAMPRGWRAGRDWALGWGGGAGRRWGVASRAPSVPTA